MHPECPRERTKMVARARLINLPTREPLLVNARGTTGPAGAALALSSLHDLTDRVQRSEEDDCRDGRRQEAALLRRLLPMMCQDVFRGNCLVGFPDEAHGHEVRDRVGRNRAHYVPDHRVDCQRCQEDKLDPQYGCVSQRVHAFELEQPDGETVRAFLLASLVILDREALVEEEGESDA